MRRVRGADKQRRKLHSIRGKDDYNDKRRAKEKEDALVLPSIDLETIEPPAWLSDEGQEIFFDIVEKVAQANVGAVTDIYALNLLVGAYTSWLEIRQTIAREGMTVEVVMPNGVSVIKPHPLLPTEGRTMSFVRGLLIEFGMTPSSRRSVMKRDGKTPDNSHEEKWGNILGDEAGEQESVH